MQPATRHVRVLLTFAPAALAAALLWVALGLAAPVAASPSVRVQTAPTACRPLRGAETVQAAARLPCVRVFFAGVWYVDLRGSVLLGATGVSAAQVPGAVVWLSDASATVPAALRPGFTLYRTLARPAGGDVAQGARAYATLPSSVRTAVIADAGDGVAVVISRLPNGWQAVWAVSYTHPKSVRELARVPLSTALTAAVRRQTVVVWTYGSTSARASTTTLYVSHVTGGVAGPVHTYRGPTEGSGWYLDGLRIGGRAVPGIAPLPLPPVPGFRTIHAGAASDAAPTLRVPANWRVRALPGGSSVGVEATDPRDPVVHVTVWLNGCVGCYAEDPLGLVPGPDTPTAGMAPGTAAQWVGDHAVRYTVRRTIHGKAYVETVLVTVPPTQGDVQVSVTLPANDRSLAARILATFRWS